MNTDDLLQLVPERLRWNEMDNPERKQAVESLVDAILLALTEDRREPDHWEATDLGAALNALLMGWYSAALTYAMYSVTPPKQRAQAWPREEHTPTAALLMRSLHYVRGAPVSQ